MRLCEANQFIALAKIESGRVWPKHPPLHGVFRFHHVEFASQD
jgi:hypothetical protein